MTEYRFVLTPYDPSFADELSRALEKRTELSSRKKYPGLWRQTDRLHAYNERTGNAGTGKGRKIFRTVLTVVLLLLGLFLLIPGLMDPKNLKEPLVVGILAVSCALFRIVISVLHRRGQKRDPRYDAAAEKVLAKLRQFDTANHPRVIFSEDGMHVEDDETSSRFPLNTFDTMIETSSLFVMTYDGIVTALKKSDLTGADPADFCAWLREALPCPVTEIS